MRRPMPFAITLAGALALTAAPLAAQQQGAAPAHKPGPVVAGKPSGTPASKAVAGKPATQAPARKAAPAPPPLNLDLLARRASLDVGTRARVAPHVAGMNQELTQLRQGTATARRDATAAQQDSLHRALSAHYAAFQRHWMEADALLTPTQKAAFDAAVREQMGARGRVGNPHTNLPSYHPKVDAKGGKAKP